VSALPPVPEEAITAVLAAAGIADDQFHRTWVRRELEAAQAHMYAAALRDAAERLEGRSRADSRKAVAWGMSNAADLLRRWADEAVRPDVSGDDESRGDRAEQILGAISTLTDLRAQIDAELAKIAVLRATVGGLREADQRAELVRVIRYAAITSSCASWSDKAGGIADAVIAAGWRRHAVPTLQTQAMTSAAEGGGS
jgi:hypothetical protein